MMRRLLILGVVILGTLAAARLFARGNVSAILNSSHDFRANSAANVRSLSGRDACIFCHTPHNADAGNGTGALLWNHKVSLRDFSSYTSSTLQSVVTPIQPKAEIAIATSGRTPAEGLAELLRAIAVPDNALARRSA